jgi:hypothetical protein
MKRTLGASALAIVLIGCTHTSTSVSRPPGRWPSTVSEPEIAQCKRVAFEAAVSPEMWQRFRPKRITADPVKLDPTNTEWYLDEKRQDRIKVAIASGGHVGWHQCFIGVTVARGTYKVMGMEESYWP